MSLWYLKRKTMGGEEEREKEGDEKEDRKGK